MLDSGYTLSSAWSSLVDSDVEYLPGGENVSQTLTHSQYVRIVKDSIEHIPPIEVSKLLDFLYDSETFFAYPSYLLKKV